MRTLGRGTRPPESRVRAPRYNVDRELLVESKTIGTDILYPLTTDNVSKSGLLLTWDHNSPVPFLVNTILELTIDPQSRWLDRPVACLGKVVRRMDPVTGEPSSTQFGVRIIQIDTTDLNAWESCVDMLETRAKGALGGSSPELVKALAAGDKN